MGRRPCCGEADDQDEKVKKGPWTAEEDEKLVDFITHKGHTNWKSLPKLAGLNRCGKSCRLRWTNYLRPDIKRGKFSDDEERLIINLHAVLGNKWSRIATHMPGRTDNEIKNYYNTHIRKKLLQMGIDPQTHKPRTDHLQLNQFLNLSQLIGAAHQLSSIFNNNNNNSFVPQNFFGANLQSQPEPLAQAAAQAQVMQNLLHLLNPTSSSTATTATTTSSSSSSLLSSLMKGQQQLGPVSAHDELLLAKILNPLSTTPAITADQDDLFCSQFLNQLAPLPVAAAPFGGQLPGLVSGESSSPEGSSSSLGQSKTEMTMMMIGGSKSKMEGSYGGHNNGYSEGTTAEEVDGQLEDWEKLLTMDDFTSGSGFFSPWKDGDVLME